MSDATRPLQIGGIYRFNAALAEVIEVTEDEVRWREHRHGKALRTPRKTPRWYFQKYVQSAGSASREYAEQRVADAYQIVGWLLTYGGLFNTADGERALDYLSGAPVDGDILPWPRDLTLAAAPGPVSADMEEMRRTLATICEQAAGVAGVSGLAGVPSKAIDAGRALLSRLNSTGESV